MNALEKKGAIIPSSKEVPWFDNTYKNDFLRLLLQVLKDVVIEKNIFEDVSESVAHIKEW